MVNNAGSSLTIGVDAWCGWEPREGGSPLCTSYRAGESVSEEPERPQLESVPPMQRRRLSVMARVAFHVLGQCASSDAQEPVIFSSVMGEIRRTQDILDSMAAGDAVSPAAFSLSVHNSVAGLWSLVHGNKAPMLSLAPIGNSPVPALLEAAGVLAEGRYRSVLVVFCEEEYPEFYRPFMASPHAPTAMAMRLMVAGEQQGGLVLSVDRGGAEGAGDTADNHRLLARLLHGHRQPVTVVETTSLWQLALVG